SFKNAFIYAIIISSDFLWGLFNLDVSVISPLVRVEDGRNLLPLETILWNGELSSRLKTHSTTLTPPNLKLIWNIYRQEMHQNK
ncbi:hypothetical protein ES319_A03G150100v1, partial [Gossypium barbadense]